MNTDERVIRDQVTLAAAYHFLLALAYLIGAAAIFVYAILPKIGTRATDLPQQLFVPTIGLLLSLLFVGLYSATGAGLSKLSNSARVSAVFLALVGTVGGLFGLSGTMALGINALYPNGLAMVALGLGSIATYALTAGVDLIVLVYLVKMPVREVFYAYSPLPLPEVILSRQPRPKAEKLEAAATD